MASLSDVAKMAGVSITTASFVLNGRTETMRISPTTVEKVLKAVQELGYVPNVAAKKLTSPASRSATIPEIAIMWATSLQASFPGMFVACAQDIFDTHQVREMHLMVAPFTMDHLQKLEDHFWDRHYNGLIFSPVRDDEFLYIDRIATRIPVVVLHVQTEHHPNVVIDYRKAGQNAAGIFSANGCRTAGLLCPKYIGETTQPDLRYLGFQEICLEAGVALTDIDPSGYLVATSHRERSLFGQHTARTLLEKKQLPEAFFIQDESIAVGFVTFLAAAGVRIPEDIQVITYGSAELSDVCYPSLTTLDYPIQAIALESLQLMSEQLGDPFAQPRQIFVLNTVTFRESCPKPKNWPD